MFLFSVFLQLTQFILQLLIGTFEPLCFLFERFQLIPLAEDILPGNMLNQI